MITRTRSNRSRRGAAFVGFTLAGVVALAGCASGPAENENENGGGGETAASDEPVTLRMSFQATAVASPYQTMAEQYAEENPHVTFEFEEVPNEQYGEVLRTQLQGGNAPDLFFVTGGSGNPQSVLPLAEAGHLLALTDTPAADLVTESAAGLLDADGDIWAQPVDYVPVTWNWNETVATEVGVELPLETVEDVLDACEVAADAGKNLIQLAGSTVPNNGLTTMQIAASRVYGPNPDWNEQRAAGDVTFAESDEWAETLEVMIELNENGCFQPSPEAGVIAENAPAVTSGTALSAFAPGAATADYKQLVPDNDYVAIAFPGTDDAETRLFASPTNAFAVNAASDEAKQAAALEFLAWLAEPENSDELSTHSGNISITVGEGADLPEPFRYIEPYLTDPELNQPLASLLWPNPGVYTALGTGVQGLLTGQTTIPAVLAAMDAEWDR